MPRPDNRGLVFVAGLLAIAVLYGVYNLYLLSPPVLKHTSQVARPMIKLGFILAVYVIGLLVLRNFRTNYPSWLLQVWHILYAGLTTILIIVGLYDSRVHELPLSLRDLALSSHEFLISPIPLVLMGIIGRMAAHTHTNSN